MAPAKSPSKLKRLVATLMLLAAIGIGVLLGLTQQFASQPLRLPENGATVTIEPGDRFGSVLAKLRGAGIVQGYDVEWKVLATTMRVASKLQAGDYLFTRPITPRGVLAKMARGDVIRYKITLVEGWSFREVRAAIQAEPNLAHDSAGLSDADIMARLKRPGVAAEGRFLPETYFFTRGSSDLALLERAAEAMDLVLDKAWQGRDNDLPLASPDQLLTLASIVEKETGRAEERPQIAGVFVRRLKIGMRLQTDPTVIYGMGSAYDGNIRRSDLETDTPYNTYTRAGLPPTPIAMPGLAAIAAAAHPAKGDALYFVASGNGAHVFAATLDEHNANVRKFQLKR